MSETPWDDIPDPLAAVDFEAIAADNGVASESLGQVLVRMQRDIRSYPGVADIVYEYRRAFARDPLVTRVDDCYYLLVPSTVWPEFGDALDVNESMLTALKTVHARAFADCHLIPDGSRQDDRDPLLLVG